MMNENRLTISQLATQLKTKQISPVELLDHLLDRVDRYEGTINSFILVMREIAKEQAQKAEAEITSGRYRGPLHGIPISLKDIISYADVPMTNGSRVDPNYIPSTHATVTEKLLNSGAVIMGKAHLHEFAYKAPHPYYEWTKNPWDVDRVPGGSSSGSGAAVQAGFVLASIGTDTGGSIRLPASLCGVVGLKPTYGRVSRHGVTPLSWTLDHVGPLTMTCEDAALVLESIAGYDPKDSTSYSDQSWDFSEFKRLDDLKGKKIGIPESFIFGSVSSEIEASFREALTTLEKAGAEIIPLQIDGLQELQTAQSAILISEAYAFHMNNLEKNPEGYHTQLRQAFEVGQFYTAADYIQSQRYRKQMMVKVKEIFDQVDVIVTPSTPEVAPTITDYEKQTSFTLGKFTFFGNILGLPSLTVPSGFSTEGLPIGLQIFGAPYEEGKVLSIGHVFEQETKIFQTPPNESRWEAAKELT